MKLNFPTKFAEYPVKNKNYYSETYKKDIINVLLKGANVCCMYCGRKLILDNEYYFNLDHAIEKDGYKKIEKPKSPFTNCKFNLSITCVKCNQKYKNKMINRIPYNLINKELNCLHRNCNEPCQEYLHALEEYLKINKIILQPFGVENKKKIFLGIQYDLLKQIYIPIVSDLYSETDIDFIEEHIARFNLNRDTASTCIINVCELIWKVIEIVPFINTKEVYGVLEEVSFDNIMAKKFVDFLETNISNVNLLKDFCELYIILSYI